MIPAPVPRYNVLGVGVSGTDLRSATNLIVASARDSRPLAVSALAVHAIMEARDDDRYRARLNALDMATPDGQPVRWAMNSLHAARLAERVYGPFLMRDTCAAAAKEGLSVYLFGSTPGTLARLSSNLAKAHPGLRIAGMRPSRFRRATKEEALEDARLINESGARIVFCGLGCPRQEAWVHAMRPWLPFPLIGVGAAFALWAGERPMAPAWMQRSGLEWLYRLTQEPMRLAHRYLVQGPRFLVGVALQKMGRRAPGIEPGPVAPDYWG